MLIPSLPPSTSFELLPRSEEAIAFTFAVKRAALGPYIIERWGWDDAYQDRVHREHFDAKPFWKIVHSSEPVGTLSFLQCPGYLRFGEFYILPQYQRAGLGTRILRHCMAIADDQQQPVQLEYLKWNPVGSLYRRNGFLIVGETEIHCLMERAPVPKYRNDESNG